MAYQKAKQRKKKAEPSATGVAWRNNEQRGDAAKDIEETVSYNEAAIMANGEISMAESVA